MVPHKAITNQVGGIRLKLLSLLLLLLLLLLFSNNLLLITKLTIKTYLQLMSLKKKKLFTSHFISYAPVHFDLKKNSFQLKKTHFN